MNWRKIQNLSFVKQGALNGFTLGSLIQLPFIAFFIYDEITAYLKNKFFPVQESSEAHICVARMIDDTQLWFVSLVFCLIVALSCFVVQKSICRRIKSPIVLWQFVGLISFIFFYLYSCTYTYIKIYLRECYPIAYESCQNASLFPQLQPNWSDLPSLLVALGIFLIFNLLFAFALRRLKPTLP
jgi:hypothetical protein